MNLCNLNVRGHHHDPDHPPDHHPHVIRPLLWSWHKPRVCLHHGQLSHQPDQPLRHPQRLRVSEHQEFAAIPGIHPVNIAFCWIFRRNLQYLCHSLSLSYCEYLQPGLDCVPRIPRIVVSTVSPEPCPSDTSDTTCTSIQSDSSQSSAASAASWTSDTGDETIVRKWNKKMAMSVFLTHFILLELLMAASLLMYLIVRQEIRNNRGGE